MLDRSHVTTLVLSIGATEPWNAAGLGLDIRALAACGVRALTIVCGVTAQDRDGLWGAAAIAPDLIAAQLRAIDAAPLGAVRIGALLDPASVGVVVDWLERRAADGRDVPIAYDPVLGPSGGGAFAGRATFAAIVERLVPRVDLIAPNLAEIARLTETDIPDSPRAMAHAGALLRARGARAVLVTGGHLPGDPTDVRVSDDGTHAFVGSRIAGTLRGTGCLLTCALAAQFARGATLDEAIVHARAFVRDRFASAIDIAGMRVAY